MSFFYPTSSASARSRRTRDKDSNGRTSSISSHRRSRDATKLRDERSPPPPKAASTPSSLQNSIYSQQNLTLDSRTEPSLLASDGSTSVASPVLKSRNLSASVNGVYHLPYQLQTPAALQQYLDSGEDESEEEDEEDDDDDDEEEEEDEEDEEDEDEEEVEVSSFAKNPSDTEPEIKTLVLDKAKEKQKEVEATQSPAPAPAKIATPPKPVIQPSPEDLTPQPKKPGERVLPFQDEQKMPGQFPLPKTESPKYSDVSQQHERPKMSASSISLQELSRQSRDSASLPSNSPTLLSRSTSNIEEQPSSFYERSFTPPAPPQSAEQTRGSPAFISPLPVRPHYPNHRMYPYHNHQPHHIPPSMHQVLEMNQPPPPMAYYMPNQVHHHHQIGYHSRHPSIADTSAWDQPQQPPEVPTGPTKGSDEQTVLMIRRIQAVLPDFHALLDCHRDISSKMGLDENVPKTNSIIPEPKQIEDTSRSDEKDLEIETLTKELELVKRKLVVERNKLRLQVGNLEEEKRALEEELSTKVEAFGKLNESFQDLRDRFNTSSIKFSQENGILQSRLLTLQEQLNIKSKAEQSYEANLAAKDEAYRQESSHRDNVHRKELEAKEEDHCKANESLANKLTEEKKRNEENLANLRSERDTTVRAREAQIDNLRRTHADATEAWAKEREMLKGGWEKECREIKIQWEDHCRKLTSQHIKDREELQRSWETSQQKQLKRHDQLEDEKDELKREITSLKAAWSTDKSKYARTTDEFRAMASRLQSEHVSIYIQKQMEIVSADVNEVEHAKDDGYLGRHGRCEEEPPMNAGGLSYDTMY